MVFAGKCTPLRFSNLCGKTFFCLRVLIRHPDHLLSVTIP